MIGDDAKKIVLISNIKQKLPIVRMIVDIHGRALPDDIIFGNKEAGLYETAGRYGIAWRPSVKQKGILYGNYIIYCDMFERRAERVASWEDFEERSAANPICKFLLQWSNISAKLFSIAEDNPGVIIPFIFKVEEYNDYLEKLFREEYGKEPTGYSLLSSAVVDSAMLESRKQRAKIMKQTGEQARQERRAAARGER